MDKLLKEIKTCKLCVNNLPFDPKPILNFSKSARILIVGQAPGIKAHNTNKPWNDASGERLRTWLNVSSEIFYDEKVVGITPMGFCYPGKAKTGDLPPRPECSRKWMSLILEHLNKIELKIIIGSYAHNYFINSNQNLTQTIRIWDYKNSNLLPLPHPSPRNNIWLKKNAWFEKDILPLVQSRVANTI